MISNPIDILSLKTAIHVIAKLKMTVPVAREVYYSVTLDPLKISPSKEFIRCGDVQGDEITGWIPVGDIEVLETLGVFEAGEKIPYHQAQAWPVSEQKRLGAT